MTWFAYLGCIPLVASTLGAVGVFIYSLKYPDRYWRD